MPRVPVLGLRGRLVAALILISAVVLGVVAFTLLPPLQRNLRTEEVRSLRDTALASRSTFEDIRPSSIEAATPHVQRVVEALKRRTGARVLLFDTNGKALIDTDPKEAGPFDDVRAALGSSQPVTGVVVNRPDADTARLALPLTIEHHRFVLVLRRRLDDARSATRVVTKALITATVVGLAVALVLGLGIAATLLRRLRRLRDATLMLADRGLDSELAGDNKRDEVGDLGRAFTTMQERLREQEHARRAFVATASHELRTPLASLAVMLELLEEDLHVDPADIADARRQVAEARNQSTRLAGLAADLLDLSRIDAAVQLRREAVDLGELTRAVLAEFGGRVPFEEPSDPCWAMGDPSAVARIVRILVDNALRFAPDGDQPDVTLTRAGDHWLLVVSDQGPGVPEEEREVIFERFKRGSATGGEAGFGLGLAIGRELADRMAGSLTLEPSETGARFVLRLQAAPALGRLTEIQQHEVPG